MRVDAPSAALSESAIELFDSQRPDLLHFHTFGLAEAAIARIACQRGIPYAFTYHSPAWTCRRETLLRFGNEPCDGEVKAWRCSACQSEERLRLGPAAGHVAAAMSGAFGWTGLILGRNSLRRRTAFYFDTRRYRTVLRKFLSACDLVIACCDWSTPVLLRNGARAESLSYCPQGVSTEFLSIAAKDCTVHSADRDQLFTVGYIGRITPVKGVHILMEGFLKTREPSARLRIVGWEPENSDSPYSRLIRNLAKSDQRIELVPKTNYQGTMSEYRRLSLVAIPSVSVETGPLTLLEALAIGVPVYGSNRIGQLNLLRERGRVIEPNSPEVWHLALEEAFTLPISRLQNATRGTVRSMSIVVEEMVEFYRQVACLETGLLIEHSGLQVDRVRDKSTACFS